MISEAKATFKRAKLLVLAAERLAAVQYEAGLKSGSSNGEAMKQRVDKCWHEFELARAKFLGGLTSDRTNL